MSDGEWMSASDFTLRVSCVHVGESAKWNMGAWRRTPFRSALSFHHVSAEDTLGSPCLAAAPSPCPRTAVLMGKNHGEN